MQSQNITKKLSTMSEVTRVSLFAVLIDLKPYLIPGVTNKVYWVFAAFVTQSRTGWEILRDHSVFTSSVFIFI